MKPAGPASQTLQTAEAEEAAASFDDLRSQLEVYLKPEQIEEVYRAYQFGAQAHRGQQRLSGEPFIQHPLAVASILAAMRLDHRSIAAAILHDVIEDTTTVKEQVVREFGEEVAELVDGVSKLTQIKFENHAEAQAENFRKMLLAMVKDLRVIIIKLADRLHNMRTLGVVRTKKRRRIARETLEIYAPIANRLGMNSIRIELQDLGFRELYPMRYRVLSEAMRQAWGNRKEVVNKIGAAIRERLEQEGLDCEIEGREKHVYSVYQKMRAKHLPFSEVFDVYAFRILVDSVDTAYRVLGAVHNLYKPVPGKFKDYIAIPKANGYQSLHTVLFGPYGVPIEVQIRTREMHKVAEAGVAAHWLYKAADGGQAGAQVQVREWLRGLLEMQQNAGDSVEFLENVKIDLFPDAVYVFTPRGQIMQLPRGATPVDFAYAVHTDVGNTCVAAKIDRQLAPLSSALNSGQTIEIITAPGARPSPAWLSFVVTGKARSNIRHFLKNLRHEESIALGRRLLDKALAGYGLSIAGVSATDLIKVLKEYNFKSTDDLFEDIGFGRRLAPLVARRVVDATQNGKSAGEARSGFQRVISRYMPGWLRGGRQAQIRPLAIRGTEGMVVTYAKCCRPIPGDPIVGVLTAGRGIVVHVESCKNIVEIRNDVDKCLDIEWEEDTEGDFPVDIRVHVINRRGVLATVAAAIAEMDTNIDNVGINERDGKYSTLNFTLEVHDRQHLASVMRHIRSIDSVVRITRAKS